MSIRACVRFQMSLSYLVMLIRGPNNWVGNHHVTHLVYKVVKTSFAATTTVKSCLCVYASA